MLREAIPDPQEAARASAAWNKMLMVQLDILLAGYLIDVPNEPVMIDDGSLDGIDVD
jgi:hypothetical protein